MPVLLLTCVNIILTLLALLGLHFPLINNKIESNLLTYRQKSDSVRLSEKTNSNYTKNHKPTRLFSIKSVRSISHCVNVSKPSIPSSFSTQTSMFSTNAPLTGTVNTGFIASDHTGLKRRQRCLPLTG